MRKYFVTVTILALVAVLAAGCAVAPSPAPTPTPAPERANFRLLISDEVNAIGHFASLNVTISSIGLQRGGEPGVWVTENITPPETADLTKLTGDSATELWNGHVEPGEYTKVFIYVDNVTGNPPEDVKLPSNKLQISKPFTVSDNTTTSFVFDVTVVQAGKSGKYILKPQIAQSGHDKPFNLVKPRGKPEVTGKPEGKGKPEDKGKPEGKGKPGEDETEEDTTPPLISISGVANDQQYSGSVTPIIEVSDDTDEDPTIVATLNGNSFISGTVIDEVGEYELEITATDASDNEAEVTITFEIEEAE